MNSFSRATTPCCYCVIPWQRPVYKEKVQGHEMNNPTQFRIIGLYAVNELRRKGSHAEPKVLPAWD
jgi:hypothetical protein